MATPRPKVNHGVFHAASRIRRGDRHYDALEKYHDKWTPILDKREELAHLQATYRENLTENKLKSGGRVIGRKEHARSIVNGRLSHRLDVAEKRLNTAEEAFRKSMKRTIPVLSW